MGARDIGCLSASAGRWPRSVNFISFEMQCISMVSKEENTVLFLALIIASTGVALSSFLITQLVSINYGIGAGAYVQSVADNRSVVSGLTETVSNINSYYRGIFETYVLFIISIGIVAASVVLYKNRNNPMKSEFRVYAMLNLVLTIIYIPLFLVIFSSFVISAKFIYLVLVFGSMAAVIVFHVVMQYLYTPYGNIGIRRKGSFAIDPTTPYSNLINLKDNVFANLSGTIRIVDKHFNSVAVENLHRLIADSLDSYKAIDIITSDEMLDSDFNKNFTDFKRELNTAGVEANIKIMNIADASDQHERFIFDDSSAFKIPPFNIIHKKSEHITRINVRDARKRYDVLDKNSVKIENYMVRKDRET